MSSGKWSFFAFVFCCLFIFATGFFYYPKWKQWGTEATISWDVSGYYFYLPAIFIYQDIKELKFRDEILEKYRPTPDLQQAFEHESGNYVLKYSAGQAVQYLPFFALGHWAARSMEAYPADGFSKPYQLAISIGTWLIAFLGLYFLRKILLRYFSDGVAAITLLALVLGSNYLDYSAINGAMTHNHLFTIYALLIWNTIRFYEQKSWWRAIAIGLLIGLAGLTRPTELIACLIPLLWGLSFSRKGIQDRLTLWAQHWPKLVLAVILTGLVGSLQLIYWKYVSGDWIVYSYQDQGFSWLRPHVKDGLFSYRSGWLRYSPMLFLSLFGFPALYRQHRSVFGAALLFSLLFMYITFAWDIWWYGGSLGQRAMVQAYPVLAFPMAAFLQWAASRRWLVYLLFPIMGFFIYYNLWLTHNAHKGGLLKAGQMTKHYYWAVFLRNEVDEEVDKLLDNSELFRGERKDIEPLFYTDFEQDTTLTNCGLSPIEGNYSLCLNKEIQNSQVFSVPLANGKAEWVRAKAIFHGPERDWNFWTMTQFLVRFYKGEEVVKEKMFRVFRLLPGGSTRELHQDVKCPKDDFDRVGVQFWHANGQKILLIDNLTIESFNE